ncbi:MAG: hypothetical protein HS108_03550 [Planctomycetes bacterium]|nr:hypothetical protein [Planctomycetota bacterium]MCL4730203.1 hypothetical protein [Planctomycetota bacterium]
MRTGLAVLALLCVALALPEKQVAAQDHETLLKSSDPKFRIEAANRLAAQNTKAAVETIVRALMIEEDGHAGREMGRTLKAVTSGDALVAAEKLIGSPKKPGDYFAAVWALTGIAAGASATGDSILQNALKKGSAGDVSLRACALEAIGESGREELVDWILPLLRAADAGIDKANPFETLSLLAAARKLGSALPEDKRRPLIEALVHVLEVAKDERVDYFTANALARLTGKEPYLDAAFWKHWLMGGTEAAPEEGKTVARPTFFNAVAVGTRVLFIVDISGSMDWPADMAFRKNPVTGRSAEKGPDYTHVKTKMDLAKVELIWSLTNLPENIFFNVIVYETTHRLIDEKTEGLVQAKPENKTRFANLVRALKANGGTNIHGSLMRGMRMTKKKSVEGDVALDRKLMLEGVDTIFFLTDGTPSWSDESTEFAEVHPKWGAIGNGKFCKSDAILADVARVNTFRKVVIHAIAVGKDADHEMMKKLAEQNHGQYVNRG